ncbi:MAG: DUF503 domain-containing protein [Bacillota bacterium]
MFVRALTITLFIQDALTLKDKRQVLQSLMERVRRKYNVAVAEVGYQEQWQRSELGLAFISNEFSYLDQLQQEVLKFIEARYPVEITEINVNDL